MFQMFKRLKKQDVLAVLNEVNDPNIDPFANWEHLRELCEKDSAVFTETLLEALESADDSLRARAVRGLALTPIKDRPAVQAALIAHLKTDSYAVVRNRCAFGLVDIDPEKPHPPQVLEALIYVSKDADKMLANFACSQLGHLAGPAAIAALFAALSHPIWIVRLTACQQLIQLKKADAQVIATLEALQDDPEASEYDAYMDDEARRVQELLEKHPQLAGQLGEDTSMKMGEILEKAREVVG